ncbi:MAG: hypothetical protein LBV47_02270 [Bacteroidales bacterium]|jgi:hypothetical protein|nr:hypothetical protein [Bacteroidales bacterium]
MKKTVILLTLLSFLFPAALRAQKKQIQIKRKALDVGVYDYGKVNGTTVATKHIVASSPVLGPIVGPNTVYKGQTYVSFQLMPNTFPGLTYELSAGNLILVSSIRRAV